MSNAIPLASHKRPQATWRRIVRLIWVPVILVAVGLSMAATVTANHSQAMSPVDEWVYVDYLFKMPTQGLVHQGEEIGMDAREVMACDGVTPFGPMGPSCGSDYSDATEFPYEGISSADAYTPAYFGVTLAAGEVIQATTGIGELSSWRLTGSIWLALTSVILYALMRAWQVSRPVALGLGLAFIASPFSWWTYTYVSTDAPSVAFGALILLAAVKFGRNAWSGWWIPVIGTVAVLFKVTNILAVCLGALYLLILWIVELKATRWEGWRTRRPDGSHSFPVLGIAVVSLVASIAAQITWLAYRSATSVGEPVDQAIGIPLTGPELITQLVNFLPAAINANVSVAGLATQAYAIPTYLVEPLSWICVAGVLGAFWTYRRDSASLPLVASVTIAAIFFAPMLAILIQYSTGTYFPLPPRYGAPILGAFLLAAGLMIKNIWSTSLLLVYSVGLTVAVLVLAPGLA